MAANQLARPEFTNIVAVNAHSYNDAIGVNDGLVLHRNF
jgi:hypothetical protein